VIARALRSWGTPSPARYLVPLLIVGALLVVCGPFQVVPDAEGRRGGGRFHLEVDHPQLLRQQQGSAGPRTTST
jgi:hypothetical protein